MAEDATSLSHRTWVNRAACSLLTATPHSTGSWGKFVVNSLTQLWILYATILINQIIISNGATVTGLLSGKPTAFLISVETCFIGEIHVWYFKPGQKLVTGEVRGPSVEVTAVLLNEYDIPSKLP